MRKLLRRNAFSSRADAQARELKGSGACSWRSQHPDIPLWAGMLLGLDASLQALLSALQPSAHAVPASPQVQLLTDVRCILACTTSEPVGACAGGSERSLQQYGAGDVVIQLADSQLAADSQRLAGSRTLADKLADQQLPVVLDLSRVPFSQDAALAVLALLHQDDPAGYLRQQPQRDMEDLVDVADAATCLLCDELEVVLDSYLAEQAPAMVEPDTSIERLLDAEELDLPEFEAACARLIAGSCPSDGAGLQAVLRVRYDECAEELSALVAHFTDKFGLDDADSEQCAELEHKMSRLSALLPVQEDV